MVRLCFLLLFAASLRADQVTLSNGDRLTGTIVRSDEKSLVLKSEFAGTVTITWDAITGISAPGPLYIGLRDRQTIVGSVEGDAGQFTVSTQAAGVVNTAKDAIRFIRNQEEYSAAEAEIERLRNPRLVDLWTGNLDLGFAASQGNASTQSLTLASTANRETARDKISVYYTSIFSATSVGTATGERTTTANSKRGGVAYNLNLTKKWFVFGSTDLESDQFQRLDLRFVPAGGVGYHAIANTRTKLDFSSGASGNREFFSTGLNRTSAEMLLGQSLTHNFNDRTSLQQKLVFFPNLSNTGNYRINFDITGVTALRRWFAWQFTISDRYLSNPVPGRKTNDILYSSGVRLTFTR
jgi:putative salt-induced outer membrane protein YdiY